MSFSADIPQLVDQVLQQALSQRASDVHFEPSAEAVEVRYRIDGLLQTVDRLPLEIGRSAIIRLMVMAHLLTYRQDVPQEGRLALPLAASQSVHADGAKPQAAGDQGLQRSVELRLAVMPTTHGLRAVVRMPAELLQPRSLEQLDLPPQVMAGLREFARADAGMLIVTGPAGSGKTTTIYALLEFIAQQSPGISIIALEDPVERDLPGVTQIEVSPFGQLSYERALRSILRQDPQVLMLGEIRDSATATQALQAALSGHRLVCTFHAATPAGAIARLLEMGLEPYQITGAVWGIITQRLLRRRDASSRGAGYAGRVPVAELMRMDQPLREAILARRDVAGLAEALREQNGFVPLREVAKALVERGVTDEAELRRVGLEASPTEVKVEMSDRTAESRSSAEQRGGGT